MPQKLPIGLSTFRTIREENCLYVDKTKCAYELINKGWRYFLSRPRRFGKSLFISTLEEILQGNKELFTNLWIHRSDYPWHLHGVIALDFSSLGIHDSASFQKNVSMKLYKIAKSYGLNISHDVLDATAILNDLVEQLYEQYGRVAILVDEYDSPLLRLLENPEKGIEVRSTMQLFFSAIKGADKYINFVFITGVSSFAKAGLFSGMNNLQLITLDERFADICGYTDQEIDAYFPEYIQAWADKDIIPYETLRTEIKNWYNGYRFGNNVPSIYNPFSLMNALFAQSLENFWFQSGTPTFLMHVLKKEHTIFNHETLELSKDSLGVFDIGATPLLALMFQSGYLTITGYDTETKLYKLDYPNQEVRISLQKYLLEAFAHLSIIDSERMAQLLRKAFNNVDIQEVISLLKQFFAHIPYQLHTKQESFYHALFQMICIAAGIQAQSEYSTSHGRIDLVLHLPKLIYIIEIKFNTKAEEALHQIEERRYYEPFLQRNKPIILLGLSFIRKPEHFNITFALKRLNT